MPNTPREQPGLAAIRRAVTIAHGRGSPAPRASAVIERLPPTDELAIAGQCDDGSPPVSLPPLPADSPHAVPELDCTQAPLHTPFRLGQLLEDQRSCYAPRSLAWLGVGAGTSAALANTAAGVNFQVFFQENIRNANTDEWFEALHSPKTLGDGYITFPFMAAMWMTGSLLDERPVGVWMSPSLGRIAQSSTGLHPSRSPSRTMSATISGK